MPTYEYKCSACGHQFEEFQKITDDALTDCPECKKPEVKRLISATSFQLKGSGWYKTDYGSSGSSAGASNAASGTSTASGASTASSSNSSSKETKSSEAKTDTASKSEPTKKEAKSKKASTD